MAYSATTKLTINEDKLKVAVWLIDDSDDLPRHDSVRVHINRHSGCARIESLIDVGLPILHLEIKEFRPTRDNGTIVELLADGLTAKQFGEALAISVLATNVGLFCTDSASVTGQVAYGELDDESCWQDDDQLLYGHLAITNDVAEAGIKAKFFVRQGERIEPFTPDGIDVDGVKESALLGASMMLEDWADNNIDLPDGFRDIDLHKASEALTAVVAPSPLAVEYYGDIQSNNHERRIQAAMAYPLFAELLATDSTLRSLIEVCQPIAAALGERTKLSRGHLKRLKKIRSPLPNERLFQLREEAMGIDPLGVNRTRRHRITGELGLQQTLDLLRGYPAQWAPDNEESWIAFAELVSACAMPILDKFGIQLNEVLSATRGDWKGYKSSLARAYDANLSEFDRRAIALATADTFEMVEDFARCVIFPLLLTTITNANFNLPIPQQDLRERGYDIAFRVIIGKAKNIPVALFKAARDWASRVTSLCNAENLEEHEKTKFNVRKDVQSWPALTDNFSASNGLVIQNLTSAPELVEEGKRMENCLGRTYQTKAWTGKCHIFSVRSNDLSQSFSTIELSPVSAKATGDGVYGSILQHKAKRNRPPSASANIAVFQWHDALLSGKLPAAVEETQLWRNEMEELDAIDGRSRASDPAYARVSWMSVLGRNWTNETVQLKLWVEWKTHILRKPLAQARSPSFLFTRKDVRELLERLSPYTVEAMVSLNSSESSG